MVAGLFQVVHKIEISKSGVLLIKLLKNTVTILEPQEKTSGWSEAAYPPAAGEDVAF
jgi:hypothetical protein